MGETVKGGSGSGKVGEWFEREYAGECMAGSHPVG